MSERYGIAVTTWRGTTAYALHYYAEAWRYHLDPNTKTDREHIYGILTAEEARDINQADGVVGREYGNPYKEGEKLSLIHI